MPTMEMPSEGRWTDEDPNKCLECANTRACTTEYFVAGQEYPDPPNHCECGHVTMGSLIGTTAAKEEEKAGRIPHTKICTDHWIAYMDNIISLEEYSNSLHEEDIFETEGD